MVQRFTQVNTSVIAVEEVIPEVVSSYGIVGLQNNTFNNPIEVIVEKPTIAEAPSNYGVVGRYLLMPEIFNKLKAGRRGAGGEIQLTDAIAALMQDQDVYAYNLDGTRYDCGSKLGYLKATVMYGLQHQELSADFETFLKALF
jgi:UTP--glucose-1-phosphate uridylyltransferase